MTDELVHYTHVYFRNVEGGRWDAECSVCDFEVTDLSSFETANDVAAWHEGKPGYIESVVGRFVGLVEEDPDA